MPQFVPEGGGEEKAFEALPPGFYNVTVFEVEAGYGNAGPYITWKLVVEDEDFLGSGLWHRTSMSEQAKSFPGDGFYAVLNRLNLSDQFAGRDLEFEELVGELSEMAPGCQAVIAVSQYVFNDQLRNEVDEFFTPGEGAPPHQIFTVEEAPADASPAESDSAGGEPPADSPPAPASPAPATGPSPRRPGRRTGGRSKATPKGVEPPEY